MKYFLINFFILCCFANAFCQQQKKTIEQKAHDRKINLEDFTATNNNQFKIKVFTVDKKAIVNKTHHWFIQLLTPDDQFVNYGNVELTGYLKDDPNIDFYFMQPVMKLCSEGKYIVGFAKVKHAGTYVLNIKIENFGVHDTATAEITIPEQIKESEEVMK